MKKKTVRKILSGLTVTSMSLTAAPAVADAAEVSVGAYTLTPQQASLSNAVEIPNVQGSFHFRQDVLSPSEDVFNLYGTVLTGMCAKPAFAFEEGNEDAGIFYVNESGKMKHSKTVTLEELKSRTRTRVASCSCATGPATVQAQVSGIPIASILELAELPVQEANTLTVTSRDGYKVAMPLKYALDREAMLVYRINGEQLAANQRTQLWMPGAVAKYFARDVVEIEISQEEQVPEIIRADADRKAKVNIINRAEGVTFKQGEAIEFEGYADDNESPIAAVEFSMDGGKTWTTCATTNASLDRWVYWFFAVTPQVPGQYELIARARTLDGVVSPLASTLQFTVTA